MSKHPLMAALNGGGGGGGGKRPAVDKVPAARLAPPGWSAASARGAPEGKPVKVNTVLVRDFMADDAHLQDPMRVAAFDFDGCLANTNLQDNSPAAWRLMFPNVPAVLRELHAQKYRIVIVTNEYIDRFVKEDVRRSAVAKKTFRLDAFMQEVSVPCFAIIAFAKDEYRKPSPSAWELVRGCDGREPEKASSFFVGDACGRKGDHSDSDLAWARNVGISFHNERAFFVDCEYKNLL